MSSNPISKAISESTQGTVKAPKSAIERQVESAEFYGVLPSSTEQPAETQKRGRGRPPNKSKSPGPPPVTAPSSSAGLKKPTDENVDKVIEDMKRAQLITKIRAYAAYWPEICSKSLHDLNIYQCTTEQLERIIIGFEASVNMETEIVQIPSTIKNWLTKIEPVAIGIGLNNPDHRFLREGVRLAGLGRAIESDPAIDRSIKLISVKYLVGRMPKNPILNLVWSIVMCALDVYKYNTIHERMQESADDERYSQL